MLYKNALTRRRRLVGKIDVLSLAGPVFVPPSPQNISRHTETKTRGIQGNCQVRIVQYILSKRKPLNFDFDFCEAYTGHAVRRLSS